MDSFLTTRAVPRTSNAVGTAGMAIAADCIVRLLLLQELLVPKDTRAGSVSNGWKR